MSAGNSLRNQTRERCVHFAGGQFGIGNGAEPLDLSMSILRQCCAEAMLAASRHVTAISIFIGVVVTIAKCYSAASGFVRAHTRGVPLRLTTDALMLDIGTEWTLNALLTTSNS
jgi:hypothetical protein